MVSARPSSSNRSVQFISRQENRIVSETKMSWFRLFENRRASSIGFLDTTKFKGTRLGALRWNRSVNPLYGEPLASRQPQHLKFAVFDRRLVSGRPGPLERRRHRTC